MSSKLSTEAAGVATRQKRVSRRALLLGAGAVVVAGGAGAGGLAIWNYIHEHTAVYTYAGSTDPIYALAWSPDGRRIASGTTYAAGTSIWDALTGEHVLALGDSQHSSRAHGLAWSPDGTRLATAYADALVWDARSGQMLADYLMPARNASQEAVAWSPDGTRVVSGGQGYSADPTAQVWDAASGKTLLNFRDTTPDTASGYVYALAWSPDGRWIATAGTGFSSKSKATLVATFQVWNATSGELVFTHHETSELDAIQCVAWSPGSDRLVTGDTSSLVRVWDRASRRLLLTYRGQRGYISALGWSPDGKWIASAADDATAQVWDAQTGQAAYTYRGHSDLLRALAWSPDGAYIATGGDDNTVQIWRPH
ncbi:MAG TPA: WD40 repeat domain-containing protein [Ktedonobacteraceae bacterium]